MAETVTLSGAFEEKHISIIYLCRVYIYIIFICMRLYELLQISLKCQPAFMLQKTSAHPDLGSLCTCASIILGDASYFRWTCRLTISASGDSMLSTCAVLESILKQIAHCHLPSTWPGFTCLSYLFIINFITCYNYSNKNGDATNITNRKIGSTRVHQVRKPPPK